jgi:hypothetical protein
VCLSRISIFLLLPLQCNNITKRLPTASTKFVRDGKFGNDRTHTHGKAAANRIRSVAEACGIHGAYVELLKGSHDVSSTRRGRGRGHHLPGGAFEL